MQLRGLHHLTAVTADAPGNFAFYTRVMGMRLVKKTVNQDDTSAYHLFYADGIASPGSDLTFFDWPVPRERRGSNSIVRTGLRVHGDKALQYWRDRFRAHRVTHSDIRLVDDRATLEFEDAEGQRFALIDDGGTGSANPWDKSPVPAAMQIRGLGPVTLSVPEHSMSDQFLTRIFNMKLVREYRAYDRARTTFVYAMGEGGPSAELHLRVEPGQRPAQPGAGGVHHVAFRCADATEYAYWVDRLKSLRVPSSGPVDRFYFRSLYSREPNGILYEIATDGPGFDADEPMATLGERLALPPFLEPRRAAIEAGLKPL